MLETGHNAVSADEADCDEDDGEVEEGGVGGCHVIRLSIKRRVTVYQRAMARPLALHPYSIQ